MEKGNLYARSEPRVSMSTWFKNSQNNKRFSFTICRLRTGHKTNISKLKNKN